MSDCLISRNHPYVKIRLEKPNIFLRYADISLTFL